MESPKESSVAQLGDSKETVFSKTQTPSSRTVMSPSGRNPGESARVSYRLTVPKISVRDAMAEEEFDAMLETGYRQALAGEGIPIDAAMASARNGL